MTKRRYDVSKNPISNVTVNLIILYLTLELELQDT